MKIVFTVCGKTTQAPVQALCEIYLSRLQHYWPVAYHELPDLKKTKNLRPEQIMEREGEQILASLQAGDCLVLLDEGGKGYRSTAFARQMQDWFHQSPRRLVFVVGGPYGFASAVYQRSQSKVSLSDMTFSHQIIRALFAEQLYRAATILSGEPYHHE